TNRRKQTGNRLIRQIQTKKKRDSLGIKPNLVMKISRRKVTRNRAKRILPNPNQLTLKSQMSRALVRNHRNLAKKRNWTVRAPMTRKR
ncbi:MAG TPA: hypothetical protein DCY03_10775, partial [Planctomycetaceae bacterium]|nr:hypothetical protein [Planctomycetaceae bacterium]